MLCTVRLCSIGRLAETKRAPISDLTMRPSVGPELAWLHDQRVIEFAPITDAGALDAFKRLTRLEGIIPALESSHAVARAIELAPTLPRDEIMIVNISGRGDKDIFITAMELDRENWIDFLENEVRHGK